MRFKKNTGKSKPILFRMKLLDEQTLRAELSKQGYEDIRSYLLDKVVYPRYDQILTK